MLLIFRPRWEVRRPRGYEVLSIRAVQVARRLTRTVGLFTGQVARQARDASDVFPPTDHLHVDMEHWLESGGNAAGFGPRPSSWNTVAPPRVRTVKRDWG